MKRKGKVIIPDGASPFHHEVVVCELLSKLGHQIIFLIPRDGFKIKTPDIVMDGVEYEIKSPTSSKLRKIEDNLLDAKHQSPNIILSLARTKVNEADVVRLCGKLAKERRTIKRIILITKTEKVLVFSK